MPKMRSAPGTEAPAEAPHRLRAIRAALAFAAALLAAPPGGATTIVPPRDLGELAAGSDAVVLARAEDSQVFETASLPWTAVRFAVLETVSGEPGPGDSLEVAVPGASAAGRTFLVAGSPRFDAGSTYLLFLGRRRDGLWAPRLLAYGVLAERVGSGRRLLAPIDESREAFLLERPDGAEVELPGVYERDLLVAHLRDVARGRRAWRSEVVRAPLEALEASPGGPDGAGAAIPEGCTYLTDAGVPFRWRVFDAPGTLAIYANRGGDPSLASGGIDLVQKALDFWNGIPGTGLNLLFGGTRDASAVCGGRPNFILFDDPCSEIEDLQGCTGILAYGGGSASGTHSFAGVRWATMDSWFVIVNDGAGCLGSTYYTRMLAHELGHGIGFGHFADSRALMYEYCCNAVSDLDRTCALFTYPARDPSNLRPEVSAGEDRKIALLGTTILLEGAASDDGRPAGSTLSSEWVALDGPAAPAFEDLRAPLTAAAFPESGAYLLGLLAKDGELARMAQVRVEVQVRGDSARNLVFAQGLGGYAGAVDTVIRAAAPTSDGSRSETLTAAFEDPPGSDQPAQSLIRFDGIFGTGPGKIAPGAPIRSATLELTSTNPGDGAALHRMRTPWGAAVSWADFPEGGIRPWVEAQLEPDAVVQPARPGPVRIDVTEALAAWSSSPCSNHGWALLPLGLAPSSFSSSEGSSPPRLLVEVSGPGPETLVPLGAEWRYFKGRSAPPPSWREADFEPGAEWLLGPTGIGYGDGDDATVLADMRGSYAAIFCRREFTVRARPLALRLRIDYDDGYVAYLNGVEVARSSNMGAPGTAVAWNALAGSDREAGAFEEHAIDPSLVRTGKNVLAVEVHNAAWNSTDLSFRPEVVADSAIVEAGSEWRFLRGSERLASGWAELDFNDSAWESGRTAIGYGDGDDATVLSGMQGSHLAVFLRKRFSVERPEAIASLLLQVLYDDGFVAYLNGVEIARANLPPGEAGRSTAAASSIEPEIASFYAPASLLRAGENVLAASVHNASLASSDLSFDAALSAGAPTAGFSCDAPFRRGDASGDGEFDVSDPVSLLLHLYRGGFELACADAADADDSGSLDISDAVYALTFLFLAGPSPPAPYESCGFDPTPDGLGCAAFPACEK